jgi:hypothetical protein
VRNLGSISDDIDQFVDELQKPAARCRSSAKSIECKIPSEICGSDRCSRSCAALARAVIGGLLFATPTTLLIVPYLFVMLRKRNAAVAAYGGIRGAG